MAVPEHELDRLMARLAHGDRSAFDPLFRELHPRALRVARSRLGLDAGADAAQVALLKVFARASEFAPGRPVLPWFYAVVANEIRAGSRARAYAARFDAEALDALPSSSDPERELVDHELRVALHRAIDSLDESAAESIAALLDEGPRPAIAAAAFRKRVSRAYAALRLLLGGLDGD